MRLLALPLHLQIAFSECLHGPLTGCGAPYADNATGYTSTGCPTSFPHLLLQVGRGWGEHALWLGWGCARLAPCILPSHRLHHILFTSTTATTADHLPPCAAQASSFNRTLWSLIGSAIGDEDRALHNQNKAGNMFWAPDINEFRDPRWGRGQECVVDRVFLSRSRWPLSSFCSRRVPGEDPLLTSEFAFRYVSALQGGPDERYKKIVSTCKASRGRGAT